MTLQDLLARDVLALREAASTMRSQQAFYKETTFTPDQLDGLATTLATADMEAVKQAAATLPGMEQIYQEFLKRTGENNWAGLNDIQVVRADLADILSGNIDVGGDATSGGIHAPRLQLAAEAIAKERADIASAPAAFLAQAPQALRDYVKQLKVRYGMP